MPTFRSGDPFRGREDAFLRLQRLFEQEAASRAGQEESNRLATRSEVSRSSGLSPKELDASQLARFQARKLPGPVELVPTQSTPPTAPNLSPTFSDFRNQVGTSGVSAEAEQERALQPLRDIGLDRAREFSEAVTIPELEVPRKAESISDVTSQIDQTVEQGLTPDAARANIIADIAARGAASAFATGTPPPAALEALQEFAVGTGALATGGGGEAVGLGVDDPGFIQEILSRTQGGEKLQDILSELDFEELEATYAGLTEAGVSQAVISGLRNFFATQ